MCNKTIQILSQCKFLVGLNLHLDKKKVTSIGVTLFLRVRCSGVALFFQAANIPQQGFINRGLANAPCKNYFFVCDIILNLLTVDTTSKLSGTLCNLFIFSIAYKADVIDFVQL